MSTYNFFPEGWKKESLIDTKDILQGIVKRCDENYNLYIKLDDGTEGIIPREEVEAINVDEYGLPKSNLCVGKVNKYVQFKIKHKNEKIYSR